MSSTERRAMPHYLIQRQAVMAPSRFFRQQQSAVHDQTTAVGDSPQAAPVGPRAGGLSRERAGFEVRDCTPPTTAASADRNPEGPKSG